LVGILPAIDKMPINHRINNLSTAKLAQSLGKQAFLDDMENILEQAIADVESVLLGKNKSIRLAFACLLARGHLLIEDLPGMGKTTLAHALAAVLGLDFKRVQFTNDLLPSDVLGVSIYDRNSSEFRFQQGPIFTQVLLADEINRATPKTQSALLEAMAEGQVTVEGRSLQLPKPFFVIATQNPSSQAGTYALPESQLDRFLMRISLGYPDAKSERRLLQGEDIHARLLALNAVLPPEKLAVLQAQLINIHTSDALLDYVQRLVEFSRTDSAFSCGLSPRGALALLSAARAWALIVGRSHVVPEDIQRVLPAVTSHRLQAAGNHQRDGYALADYLLNSVPVL
jgi:MoxR-like ATPase